MRLIVAGGREFSDAKMADEKLSHLTQRYNEVEVVCGMARGADTIGRLWAEKNAHKVKKFPAEWDIYGKAAGYRRNEAMAEYATHLVAFWDGRSKGTEHIINLARRKGLKVRVVKY